MALKFSCTICGKEIVVKYLKVGEVAKCRNCGAEMAVPPTAVATAQEPTYGGPPPTEPVEPSEIAETGALAGRMERLGAHIVDQVIFFIPVLMLMAAENSLAVGLLGLLAILALAVIQIVFLSKDGQTIGKKAVKIRIVKVTTGENGGFVTNFLLRGVVNGLLCIIPFYSLVDILFIFRQDRRCIHDLIAGTRVISA